MKNEIKRIVEEHVNRASEEILAKIPKPAEKKKRKQIESKPGSIDRNKSLSREQDGSKRDTSVPGESLQQDSTQLGYINEPEQEGITLHKKATQKFSDERKE